MSAQGTTRRGHRATTAQEGSSLNDTRLQDIHTAQKHVSRALRALWAAQAALSHAGLSQAEDQVKKLAGETGSTGEDLAKLYQDESWNNGA